MEDYQLLPYNSKILFEDINDGPPLMLFQVPKNIDVSDLDGVRIKLPEVIDADEMIDCDSSKISLRVGDPSEHKNFRALLTSKKANADEGYLCAAKPFGVLFNVLVNTKATEKEGFEEEKNQREMMAQDSRLKEMGFVGAYLPPPQVENMKVRFYPSGAKEPEPKKNKKVKAEN
mmetsp:Transcript_16997/g.25130  ORF Transcript_16997/g.25130 Transcript_16997/m.25130 type:complete len:174 (-) Transcript_16997:113-634(-)